jgi:hypothetical protein
MSRLVAMSDEQKVILENLKKGNNCVIDAIAGSGKSTTILSISRELADKNVLQMTYNSMLRHEVKEKTKQYNIKNIKVHTFHSLAVEYYMLSAHTDTSLRYILHNEIPPRGPIPKYDLIVLDESQDMTFLYFRLMVKFINDMGTPFQLLVLGDYKQGLYEFKGADTRFLTLAADIWKNHPLLISKDFSYSSLSMSYRITQPIADFVNNVLLGEKRMYACRNGEPVQYYRQSRINTERFVISQITQLLENGAKPSDIFVLGSSVKRPNSNIRKMENALVANNIPCHVPMIEGDKIDERVIDGKVVFSTFHSVKGRQRKYTFIVGFDNSYYYDAKRASREECPNTLYVGCTRSTHGLYLLEKNDFDTDRPLDFLKMNHYEMKNQNYIQFKGIPQSIFYEIKMDKQNEMVTPIFNITPTDLIKFISESVIDEVSPILDKIFINETNPEYIEFDIPTILKTNRGFHEDISDLNGIAIPSMYYDYMQKKYNIKTTPILHTMIQHNIIDMKENEHKYLKNIINELPDTCETPKDYLYMSNIYVSTKERLYFKLKQIEECDYNWLSQSTIDNCMKRFDEIIGVECKTRIPVFEQSLIDYSMHQEHEDIDAILKPFFQDENVNFRFSARLDLVTENSVWELKCTTLITIDHLLQTVIYAWLWRIIIHDIENPRTIRILNIKSGEQFRLHASMEELTQIVVALLKSKYTEQMLKNDDEFVEECNSIM